MISLLLYRLLPALALVLPLTLAKAAPSDQTPSLSTIVAQVVARDALTQRKLDQMQYHQEVHTEQLDGNNRVTHQEEMELIVRPRAAQEIQVISVKGDQMPSNPDEASRKAKDEEAERRQQDFSLKTLVSRFNVTLAGQGDCFGQPAYILAFEPKPNQPYLTQTEKVVNQLHGRMWINKTNYLVLKTEATLAHPVSVAWFLARVSALEFHYELRSNSNEFGPAWIQLSVQINAPWVDFRQKQTVDMTDFGPRTPLPSLTRNSTR